MQATREEIRLARRWAAGLTAGDAAEPPFSFVYAGQPSAELLRRWKREQSAQKQGSQRTEHTITWRDSDTKLAVRCAAVEYHDFPAVEWTVYFKNEGRSDTPILEDIQALDTRLEHEQDGEFILHHHKGDFCTADGYEPYQLGLEPGGSHSFAPIGGRGSNGAFPYYNLQMPGGGMIIAVGWPGQWATEFTRGQPNGLRIRAGQELTHLKLHRGEEIRTPLIALLFWQGKDRIRSQNLWRRWMVAHNMPRPGGTLPLPIQPGCSSAQFGEMIGADEDNQKTFIDRYLEERIGLDYWWMDAGWYKCLDGPGPWHWPKTGTWEVDTQRFPRGLRAIADHAHARGIKIIVWFEPERVAPHTWLYENRPKWLLDLKAEPPLQDAEVRAPGEWSSLKLLDLGNPEARKWLTDHVDRLITEQGIDLYRQDFNFDPLPYWRANDAEDRQGIAENHHVTGYLAFWDELLRRHPDLLIDTCASGGRRNDLETLRRSVPLHKTDYNYADLPVKQAFHHSLFSWMPFFGAPVVPIEEVDPYTFRSALCPCTVIGFDVRRKDLDYALLRKLTAQWRRVAPCFYGDYHPLTPYSRGDDAWIAWQFDRPEQGDGIVQAFRRAGSVYESARLKLRALDPGADYRVTNLDEDPPSRISGHDLMQNGLLVTMKSQPECALYTYTRLAPKEPANSSST